MLISLVKISPLVLWANVKGKWSYSEEAYDEEILLLFTFIVVDSHSRLSQKANFLALSKALTWEQGLNIDADIGIEIWILNTDVNPTI